MKKLFHSLFALVLLFSAASCEETNHYVEGTPVLSVSTDLFIADGEDKVVLTVMVGDVDVTADAKLYVDYELMSSNVFTTTRAKEYKFFASYNGKVTKTFIVKAANPTLYLELPADAQKDKFDNFHHKVLLTQSTGTWCGWCPYMIRAIELFREGGSNAANTIVVATHSSDELSSAASEAVIASLRVNEYPSVFFNLNPETILTTDYPDINAENINSIAGMELKAKTNVGIAAVTAYNNTTAAVRAAVKVGKSGAYRINAWLVEDNLLESQLSNWPEFSDGKSTVLIEHDFVLRDASCISPIQGELLGGKESCTKGETIEYYHEFNTKAAGIENVENCKIVVLVTSTVGSKFYVDNVVECPVGQVIPFGYK